MTDAAHPLDTTILSDALVRYIGDGRSTTPVDDASRVTAAYPNESLSLQAEIGRILILSETIRLDDVGPFDQALRHRLGARLHELLPVLSEDAIRAVGWRWGFLNLR